MTTYDTFLAGMVEQAKSVVDAVKEPMGRVGWLSQQHLFSMIAAISDIFKLNVDEKTIMALINATNDIGMTKYRAAMWFMWMLNPRRLAIFNGVPFPQFFKQRTRALGFAYIELCKDVKLGRLNISEITADKGLHLLRVEFRRQIKKPRPQ